jgi:hypothetical protein
LVAMESAPLSRIGAAPIAFALFSILGIVGCVPAALLIAGTIGVWTAVAIYLAAIVLVTVASEAAQRAVRNRW